MTGREGTTGTRVIVDGRRLGVNCCVATIGLLECCDVPRVGVAGEFVIRGGGDGLVTGEDKKVASSFLGDKEE